ncbi:hypothetical protein G9A89_000050 [Geosiphon pyriformis]|nr:hypothetical protein G9A89_000050 [Geosiphon pyriformis]
MTLEIPKSAPLTKKNLQKYSSSFGEQEAVREALILEFIYDQRKLMDKELIKKRAIIEGDRNPWTTAKIFQPTPPRSSRAFSPLELNESNIQKTRGSKSFDLSRIPQPVLACSPKKLVNFMQKKKDGPSKDNIEEKADMIKTLLGIINTTRQNLKVIPSGTNTKHDFPNNVADVCLPEVISEGMDTLNNLSIELEKYSIRSEFSTKSINQQSQNLDIDSWMSFRHAEKVSGSIYSEVDFLYKDSGSRKRMIQRVKICVENTSSKKKTPRRQ